MKPGPISRPIAKARHGWLGALTLPRARGKWYLEEIVIRIAGMKHGLWRAIDQPRTGIHGL
jgi:hypothetical protein